MKTDKPLHFLLCLDETYLFPMQVLLHSIFLHVKNCDITVHLFTDKVTEKLESVFVLTCLRYGFKFELKQQECPFLDIPFKTTYKYHTTSWLRLLCGNIDAETVIYLDGDTLVTDDLSKVFDEISFDNKPIAAVRDHCVDKEYYFNAGVLYIHVPTWNEQRITERCLEFLRCPTKEITWMDQCVLNAVIAGNWVQLPSKYNRSYYSWSAANSVVLHYCGPEKPWINPKGVPGDFTGDYAKCVESLRTTS